MLRTGLIILIGFILILLSRSLFSGISYLTDLLSYAAVLYLFFYGSDGPGLLTGVTIGIELLGTSRFGQATLLALIVVCLYYLCAEQLRFISHFNRYIVAVTCTMISYYLLFLSISHFSTYLIPIVIVLLVSISISYLLTGSGKEPEYELL